MPEPPFVRALGTAAAGLPEHLRAHFDQRADELVYDGEMEEVWRARGLRGLLAAPGLWVAARLQTVFPETGTRVPFSIAHRVYEGADGRTRMTWTRTFHFPHRTRRFDAVMVYDEGRDLIDDRLGTGRLEAELVPTVHDGEVHLHSARQWFHVGRLRVRLPRWLAGEARVREWQRDDGALGIDVEVSNPLLGRVFGYRGWFRPRD